MIRTYVHDIMKLPHEVRVDHDHESQIHDIIILPCEACVDHDHERKQTMRQKKLTQIITFQTTTAAMAMEDYCREQGLPGRIIPLPQEISAGCGLCWKSERLEETFWKEQLEKAHIRYEEMRQMYV